MEDCSIRRWVTGSLIALVIFLRLFTFAVAKYEDLGHICLTTDEVYNSLQPKMLFTATPYPFVTNETNVTLSCSGTVVENVGSPEDQGYMTSVEFWNNKKKFAQRREDAYYKVRSLSYNFTVTEVKQGDRFVCIVRASFSPCNTGQITFQLQSPEAPRLSPLILTIQHVAKKFEITCVGSGVPEPKVLWLLNATVLNTINVAKKFNAVVDTELEDVTNETDSYHVKSKIVVFERGFPMHLQCLAKNRIGETLSEKVYILLIQITNVKLATATVRWVGHGEIKFSSLNVSVKCGKYRKEATVVSHNSSITFSNLEIGKNCEVKVQAMEKNGDVSVGVAEFYSPGQLPKPGRIFLKRVTSEKAVIGWESVAVNTKNHGVLQGYKIFLVGQNIYRNTSVSFQNGSHFYEVLFAHLVPNSQYIVSVYGFTEYGDGRMLQYQFKTLDRQARFLPTNEEKDKRQSKNHDSKLLIIILPVAIAIVMLITLSLILLRRRKTTSSHNLIIINMRETNLKN